MATYHITYSCGHNGRVNLVGKGIYLENKIRWYEDFGLCSDCYKAKIEADKQKEITDAQEHASENGLPELTGSEKQVQWALKIRKDFYDRIADRIRKNENNPKVGEVITLSEYLFANKTNAEWWIDNRTNEVLQMMRKEIEERKYKESAPAQQTTSLPADITVHPEQCTKNAVAEISVDEKKITVAYPKDEQFIEIVKSLGYKWDGIWTKKLSFRTENTNDRIAELGSQLLNAGFPVRFPNEESKLTAVNADYAPECTNWVSCNAEEKKLFISWAGKNDKLYTAARKITGSKWESGSVVVKLETYKEAEDFAEMFGFKLSPGTIKGIEEYKESIKTVAPAPSKEPEQKDGLKEILESDRSVIDDLRDK